MDLPRGTYLGDKVSSNGSSWHRSASEGKKPSWHPRSRADRPRYLDDFILRCNISTFHEIIPRAIMRISYSRKLPPFHDMMLSLIDCLRLLRPTSETPPPWNVTTPSCSIFAGFPLPRYRRVHKSLHENLRPIYIQSCWCPQFSCWKVVNSKCSKKGTHQLRESNP